MLALLALPLTFMNSPQSVHASLPTRTEIMSRYHERFPALPVTPRRLSASSCEFPYGPDDMSEDGTREMEITAAQCADSTCKASFAASMEANTVAAYGADAIPAGMGMKAMNCVCAGNIKLGKNGNTFAGELPTIPTMQALCGSSDCMDFARYQARGLFFILCLIGAPRAARTQRSRGTSGRAESAQRSPRDLRLPRGSVRCRWRRLRRPCQGGHKEH